VNSRQKAFLGALAALLLLLVAAGYVLSPPAEANDGRLRVVATFYPLYYFSQQVGGNRTHVDSLIPFNSEPHSWEPRPADIVNVDKARVFVYNGAGLEPWVGKFLGTLQNRNSIKVVDSSRGIVVKRGDPDSTGGLNPHFWVDPVLARQQVENIRAGLAAADPAGAAYYGQRADELKSRLDSLDTQFREGLRNRTKDSMVTTHEGFDYLAGRYNFTAYAVLGISPDQEPSAGKIADIVKIVEDHDLDVVFGEPVYSDRYMQTIANEVKRQSGRDVTVLILDGLHGRSGPHANLDYFQIQRENLKNLQIGMGVQPA
jgi:zinc transport system substrate-binding protein